MKRLFSVLVLLFLGSGIAYGDTYVSNENPDYTIYYIPISAQLFSVEECRNLSMSYKDVIKCSAYLTTHFYLQGEIVDSKMDEIAKNNFLQKIQEVQKREEEGKAENIKTIFTFSVIMASIIVAIFGVFLGRKGKVTIYLNRKDLILNSVMFYFSLASILFSIGIVLLPLWALYNLIVTIFVFRQGLLKTIISIFTRFWISFLALFLILSVIPRKKESASEQMDAFLSSAVWATILVAVYNWLTLLADQGGYYLNGNRVWCKRASPVVDIQAGI